jgi:hypothetical protein
MAAPAGAGAVNSPYWLRIARPKEPKPPHGG